MAIPEGALTLNDFDPMELTLEEMELFDLENLDASYPNKLRKFLIKHGNWSKAEVNGIKMGELKMIGEKLAEAIQRVAIPLTSSPSSKTGPEENKE